MATRRYSTNPQQRRWQEQFDDLQQRCRIDHYSPSIGELIDHGITRAQWRCRSAGWRGDGKPDCYHGSEPFDLARFGRRLRVRDLRWQYVCSQCGRNRPQLDLLCE